MDQLLNIESIPISISFRISSPNLEIFPGSAKLSIERERGGLQIESKPIQLHIDSYTPKLNTNNVHGTQVHVTYTAEKSLSQDASSMSLDVTINQKQLSTIAQQKLKRTFEAAVHANSRKEVSISFDDPIFRMKYEMDKLNFDWRMNDTDFLFTPGDIEIIVDNYPEVIIEYTGDPIYIPASANPNHEEQ